MELVSKQQYFKSLSEAQPQVGENLVVNPLTAGAAYIRVFIFY